MPPAVINGGPNLDVQLSYEAATINVDLSCDAFALEITTDTETIDLGTFCNPTASDLGKTTYSAVLSLLWSNELYTKLFDHVGEVGSINFGTVAGTTPDHGHITFQTKFGALPWGRFEIGQRVESELPLAVLSTPVWTANPPVGTTTAAPPAAPPAPAE
jgi:hypothetical protein